MSMSRRSMFGFGAAAGAAVGVGGISLLNSETKEKLPIPKGLTHTLTLHQDYTNVSTQLLNCQSPYIDDSIDWKAIEFTPSGISSTKGTPVKNAAVALTVGPDGDMYVRLNNKWRRVVTEA